MFESSQRLDPATAFPALADAIAALPAVQPGASGLAAAAELRALFVLQRRLQAAVLERVASFDTQGLALASGAASTGAWVRAYTHLHPGQAQSLVAAARTTRTLPLLAAELSAGRIGVEHLQAVAASTRQVPDDVLALHDKTLRDAAPHSTPSDLRRLGRKITEVWDAAAAAEDVNHVEDARTLHLSQTVHGLWAIDGTLTPEAGATLAAALEPLMRKRGPEDERTPGQRRADALIELTQVALTSGQLPDAGGDRTRVTLLVHATSAALDQLQLAARQPQDTADTGETEPLPSSPAATSSPRPDAVPPATVPAPAEPQLSDPTQADPTQADPTHADPTPTDPPPPRGAPADPPPADPPSIDLPLPRDGNGPIRTAVLRAAPGALLAGGRLAAMFGDGASHRQLLGSNADLTVAALTRLGCDADLALAVLDATGQPLYLSRTTRDPNVAQRRALVIRDAGCVFPSCDRQPAYCQAHHLKFWTRDEGPTDLDNLALVCAFHHWLVHDKHWILEPLPVTLDSPAGGWRARSPDALTLTTRRQPGA